MWSWLTRSSATKLNQNKKKNMMQKQKSKTATQMSTTTFFSSSSVEKKILAFDQTILTLLSNFCLLCVSLLLLLDFVSFAHTKELTTFMMMMELEPPFYRSIRFNTIMIMHQ